MVGLHFDEEMNPGDSAKQIYADDNTDPRWKFESLGDGRYLIKAKDMNDVLAGEQNHTLCAFSGTSTVGMGENGPCEWALEEVERNGAIYTIHKFNSPECWIVHGEKISVGFPNHMDENRFVIVPDML
ncbi:hypothetical protein TWF281_002128 [Arthrobotrys megalospora]